MALHGLVPLPMALSGSTRLVLGAVGSLAGIALMGMAMGGFRKTGQDPKPWTDSPELIVEGIYRWTRNPMYLGMGLLQAGLGLAFGSVWPLLVVPVTWGAIYLVAIRHEEAYLSEKFGDGYARYCASVRRWL